MRDDAAIPGAALPRRMYLPRVLGLGLGAVMVAGALLQAGQIALWPLLLLHGLAWPHLARLRSRLSADPGRTERHNLLLDGALGACWVPVMGFNLVPSVLVLGMLAMNNLAVGGRTLLLRGAVWKAGGLGVGTALAGVSMQLTPDLVTVLAAVPFMLAYPLTAGAVARRLSLKLHRKSVELQASDRLHRETLDAMNAGIVLYDAQERLVLCNADFRELYPEMAPHLVPGASFESLLRRSVELGLIPDARGREEAWIEQRLANFRSQHDPMNRRMPDGSWRRIVERRLPDGSRLGYSIDITELMQAEIQLRRTHEEAVQARERLEDALEALPEGFALFDADDRLVAWNQRYYSVYAESVPAIRRGARFEDLLRLGLRHGQYPQAKGREEAWLQERLAHHRDPQGPLMQELPGNRWLRVQERRTREGGYAGVRSEVTDLVRREQELRRLMDERDAYARELEAANAKLEVLSDTDVLTSVANRRHLDRRLREEWQRGDRHGAPLTLMLVDVDHFKRYNDCYGHPAGDACLKQVAQVLVSAAQRASDLVARFGGEEFAVLLPHTTAQRAHAVAERIHDGLAQLAIPHATSDTAPVVTVSIGLACTEGQPQVRDVEALVRAADEALYGAKRAGRARSALAPA